MLLLFTGLPGSGKSTLAKAFVARYGGVLLNSDTVRTALGLRGHYSQEDKQRVYNTLLKGAKEVLEKGMNAVIDSTLYLTALRRPYLQLAEQCHTPCCFIELKATETTSRQRVRHPRPDSEADIEVYEALCAEYEPIEEPHLELWTDTAAVEALLQQIEAYLKQYDH